MSSLSAPALPDRYDDRGLLGSGAMGQVRRARDRVLGCDVAIKILHEQLAQRPQTRSRFLTEARLTARLRHPGIVAVHDMGELPDGVAWFSMQLVEGRTLRDLVGAVHRASAGRVFGTANGWGLVDMIDAMARVCDAVGYAHGHGVLHRDIKPSNIMVGAFREVLVMDWGIARGRGLLPDDPTESVDSVSLHRTVVGKAVGTPPYMSPEQARGDNDNVGPHSDIYALGAVLYKILSGRSPYRGDPSRVVGRVAQGPPPRLQDVCVRAVPRELIALCGHAMERQPERRPETAEELGHGLRAWLDRARRTRDAMGHVSRARDVGSVLAEIEHQEAQLMARVERVAAGVQTWEPVDQKRAVWTAEDELADLRRTRSRQEVFYAQHMRAALAGVPDLIEARSGLADLHRRRFERNAEDPIAAEAALAQVRLFDVGNHATWLEGRGRLTLQTDPPGATVTAHKVSREGFRIDPQTEGTLGRTPLNAVPITQGSWLLELRAPGRHPTSLPVFVPREGRAPGPPPEGLELQPVWLPPEGAIREDECYVPAGWCQLGGGFGCEAFPARRLWVSGFVMRRHPVVLREWVEYLEARLLQGQAVDGALCHGRIELSPRGPRIVDGCSPDEPASGFTWRWARAFARWRRLVDQQPWRLPHELEWEKAARGVDGRLVPWGSVLDPSLACVLGSQPTDGIVPVTAFPSDVSVYGVRHTVGNVSEFCGNPWERTPPDDGSRLEPVSAVGTEEFVAVRGGNHNNLPPFYVSAARFAIGPEHESNDPIGFRLVRSVP